MITVLVGLPLLALAAVLQSAVLSRLPFVHGTLDLVLLLALGWTLSGDWKGGALWGLIGGLWLDALTGGPFGLMTIALVSVTFLASLAEGRLWRSHVLLPLAACLLGTLGYHLIYLLGLSLGGVTLDWGRALREFTLPGMLLNTSLMLPVYGLLRWLHDLVYPPQVVL